MLRHRQRGQIVLADGVDGACAAFNRADACLPLRQRRVIFSLHRGAQTLRLRGRGRLQRGRIAIGRDVVDNVTNASVEVLLAPGEALSTAALGSRYGVKIMIISRLEQLSAGRFIEISRERRIVLTRKGLAFGRFVTAGRRLFGIASAN